MSTARQITQRTGLVFSQLPVPAIVADERGALVATNDRCRALLGWGPAEHGRLLRSLLTDLDDDADPPALRVLEGRRTATAESVLSLSCTDGRVVRACLTASTLYEAGERRGATAVLHPAAGAADADAFESLVQQASELILVSDDEGAVRYVSPGLQRILGFDPSEVVGWNPLDFIHADDVEGVVAAVATTMGLPGESGPVACRARRRDGTWCWLEIIVTNLLDDPAVRGIVLNARDVTERAQHVVELERQALHDPLTGLPNRLILHDRITHALERIERHPETTAAVLLLDLDDFKAVNDRLGHEAGDRVLVAAANRLRGVVRPHDTVARFGGDEFVVVCQEVDGEEAAVIAARIVEAFDAPFRFDDQPLAVCPSIGTAIVRHGDDPGMILRRADAAMYREKAARRAHR